MSIPDPTRAEPASPVAAAAPQRNAVVKVIRALVLAEANDPKVHTALRNLQSAVVAAAVLAFKSYFGL